MICQACNNKPCTCTIRRDGTTNYCHLCEQANREIERLKEDLRKQDTSLLLANQNLEQKVEELEGKIEKAIEMLNKFDPQITPYTTVFEVLKILEGK